MPKSPFKKPPDFLCHSSLRLVRLESIGCRGTGMYCLFLLPFNNNQNQSFVAVPEPQPAFQHSAHPLSHNTPAQAHAASQAHP